jgi:beta-galactosidase
MAAAIVGLLIASSVCYAASPRQDLTLDSNWRFIRQDEAGAQSPTFDDSTWSRVSLPHTWNNKDGEDGGNNYYRGPGWYRRHLTVPASMAGKSLFLKFDGAATVTDVYVNGTQVGTHRGNFGAFCFDVSTEMRPGQDNLVAVRVDNAHNPDIPPLRGDFTIFGGLYRDVHLLVLNPVSIDPTDFASSGVYLTQTNVSGRSANLEITTKLRNGSVAQRDVTVVTVIRDASNREVQALTESQGIPGQGRADCLQHTTLEHPHLWDGRIDPYLYTVTVSVRAGRTLVDQVAQPLGFRFYRVDPEKGFFLDGKHYAVHGVNRHQDRIDKGWAISRQDRDQDFALMMEMGCTGVRLCHYEHSQYFYGLCDKGGLIVWAELCLVTSLGNSAAFSENARQQLTELIKQNYNHPSILFWSLFNELSFGRQTTATPGAPAPWALVEDLNKLAHQLDPTRLTTAATSQGATHPVNFITDIIAFNRYPGWYGGKPSDWPATLDALHKALPGRCIGISEYGAGASVFQHEADPKQPSAGGKWHPEEWQCAVHEAAWKAMEQRPYLWCTFLWNMFDFAADQRNEGDHPGRNDKGMVTYDRKIKKDAFFWYKANWSNDPFVYITDRCFNPRPAGPITIKVYSNCDRVSLTVNGTRLGEKASDDHRFIWDGVELVVGPNRVETIGTLAGKEYRDACVWIGQAASAGSSSETH